MTHLGVIADPELGMTSTEAAAMEFWTRGEGGLFFFLGLAVEGGDLLRLVMRIGGKNLITAEKDNT